MEKNSIVSDAQWCIDNDYQVYIKKDSTHYRIAIRRGGITTDGKDIKYIDDVQHTSSESLGSVRYKTVADADKKINNVYKYLRYGKI